MSKSPRVLAINGSYRDGGATDQVVDELLECLRQRGADVEHIHLRDQPIEFCLNCRECMQQPGDEPGTCVQGDRMAEIVAKIENADAYVLAAPTNFSSVTALFKRFSERLAVYGYWPWGKPAPVFRKAKLPKKPAVVISSCAAPGLLGRLTYSTNRNIRITARTMGAKVVGSMVTGLVSGQKIPALPDRTHRRAHVLAERLIA